MLMLETDDISLNLASMLSSSFFVILTISFYLHFSFFFQLTIGFSNFCYTNAFLFPSFGFFGPLFDLHLSITNGFVSSNSRVEFSNEKSEGCCIYRHAGIDYIALWDSLLPLWEVFAAYLGTCV